MKFTTKPRILLGVSVAAVSLLALTACTGTTSTSTSTPAASNKHVNIGFFGFAQANSFAQAAFAGIKNYAGSHNASVTQFDGAFDSAKQVQQIQDATTSGKYKVFIVQANDGTAVIPAVKAAIAAGITVVAEFTPIGTKYNTADPQVPGEYFVGDVPTYNGTQLGKLGLLACKGISSCTVAYLQGSQALPLDNARTAAVVKTLNAGNVRVISNFVGGYSADSGRTTGQDLLQADPGVDVIIGSTQAIEGVQTIIPAGSKIKLVGNGSSTQAITAVQNGKWFGAYVVPEKASGSLAAQTGLSAARGGKPSTSINTAKLKNARPIGTKSALVGLTGDYSD